MSAGSWIVVAIFGAGFIFVDVVTLLRVSGEERRLQLFTVATHLFVAVAGALPSLWIAHDESWGVHGGIVAGLVITASLLSRLEGEFKTKSRTAKKKVQS